MHFLLLVFAILNITAIYAQTTTQTVHGVQYLVTSLSASQTSDPNALAQKYGHADDWRQILLVRNSKVLTMTEKLSENIDNDETLLVPLSWTGVTAPSSDSPTPNSPKSNSSPPPPPSTPQTSSSGGSWNKAIATDYESYPTSEAEGVGNSGDQYEGMFALFNDVKSLSWVESHSLVSVAEKDWNSLKGKTIQISLSADGSNPMAVEVVDYCADSDCGGCCTQNMQQAGVNYLLDLEKFTAARFFGQTPEQIAQQGIFQPIYFSVPGASNAVADSVVDAVVDVGTQYQDTSASSAGFSPLTIGLIAGNVILFVVLVLLISLYLLRRKYTEERV